MPTAVALVADAGIGKTRLVTEFAAATAGGHRFLRAGGAPYDSNVRRGVWRHVLRGLVGSHTADAERRNWRAVQAGLQRLTANRDHLRVSLALLGEPFRAEGRGEPAAVGAEAAGRGGAAFGAGGLRGKRPAAKEPTSSEDDR